MVNYYGKLIIRIGLKRNTLKALPSKNVNVINNSDDGFAGNLIIDKYLQARLCEGLGGSMFNLNNYGYNPVMKVNYLYLINQFTSVKY